MKDYRYVVSNLKIKDDVYEALIEDALSDIAIKTDYFKKSFLFDSPIENRIYNFDDMAYQAERDKYCNTSIISKSGNDTGIYMKSFISVSDIIFIDSNIDSMKNEFYSAIIKEFKMIDGSSGVYVYNDLNNNNWKRYYCLYSYIPQYDYVTDKDESFIRNALIAKLKYDSYSIYYEANDTAFIEYLNRVYLNEIEEIKNIKPVNSFMQNKKMFKDL